MKGDSQPSRTRHPDSSDSAYPPRFYTVHSGSARYGAFRIRLRTGGCGHVHFVIHQILNIVDVSCPSVIPPGKCFPHRRRTELRLACLASSLFQDPVGLLSGEWLRCALSIPADQVALLVFSFGKIIDHRSQISGNIKRALDVPCSDR